MQRLGRVGKLSKALKQSWILLEGDIVFTAEHGHREDLAGERASSMFICTSYLRSFASTNRVSVRPF